MINSAAEALTALQEEASAMQCTVDYILYDRTLRKTLTRSPALRASMAFFESESWQRQKSETTVELLAFAEKCDSLIGLRNEIEVRLGRQLLR